MTKPEGENFEWIDWLLGYFDDKAINEGQKKIIVRELKNLKRGSVSTHGPRPELPICPDCGALMQTGFYRVSQNSESAVKVRCRGNDLSFHEFVVSNFGELRRFFAAAPAEDTPNCQKCGTELRALPTVHCPKCASTNFLFEDVQLDVERLEQIKQIRAYGLQAEPTALLLAIDDLLAALLRRVSGKGAQATPEIRCPDCKDERISFSNPFVYCRNPKCEFMVRRDSPRVAEVFRPTTQGTPEGAK